ncbi:trypsin-like peptidase domain-containing protein [Streptomyces sp. NBC_01351]|uniref:nSTAND1 domain-containing NTPase n=1 Tax=Streptomyces sp. NBC_01351 TaxID=2903833 RepID=UPI002E2F4254|nr:trypsin-like peptidase domain-containing protein [Streptomyces sp. NBC_01351]
MDVTGTTGTGPTGEGTPSGLLPAMAQIVDSDEQVAGAGFLVAENILITCAHVVHAAGSGPGENVRVNFPHVDGAPRAEGLVLDEPWRAPEDADVAVVRLSGTPPGVWGLPLGSASGCRGHQVCSFGFPAQAAAGGHFGFGVAGDLLPATESRGAHLQLTAANDLTTGFSGAPVMDEVTGLVIGMLTEITAPDDHERGLGIAYVTPTDVLREVWPDLAERDVCPYRGLEPFTSEEARWFEGRKDAARQVLANLADQRVTLLLGPSGSGKSSLVQAGVLPALAAGELPGSDRWLPVTARPRQDLLDELERGGLPGAVREGISSAVGRKLAAEPGCERVVLIIDQFEELFTQPSTGDQLRRRLTATEQITAAVTSHTRLSVILIMRDDFYPQQAALAPKLLEAAMPGLLNIPGTLSRHDLHDIVILPAQNAGAHFELGLPEQIINDVLATTPEGATTASAPVTVLPLLELTLSQLWQRRHDGYLTHDAYRRIGGVTGSLTTWCDTALDQLPPDHRPIAQRVLTSLVHSADPGRNIPAIRKQVPLHELRELAADVGGEHSAKDIDEVLAALTRHRIITTHSPGVSLLRDAPPALPVAELIHDALIRDWPTLREWVGQDHRFQEWLDHTRARRARFTEEHHPGDLLGGTTLAEGLEWSGQRRLPGEIAAFLTASQEHQQTAIRRSRRLNRVLASLLALALVVGGLAFWQWRAVETEQREALSRQLAGQSRTLIEASPDLASLLAIRAFRTSGTSEAEEGLRNAAALPLQRRLEGHTAELRSVAFSPDGTTLLTSSADGTALLWDVGTGKTVAPLIDPHGAVGSAVFSPDGTTLATGSEDGMAQLWNAETGKLLDDPMEHASWVNQVAFSPDGATLATACADGTAQLWNVGTGTRRGDPMKHGSPVWALAISPDGRTLATGGEDGTALLWDMETGKTLGKPMEHAGTVYSAAFSPDGTTLATGSVDNNVVLWDVETGKTRDILTGHSDAAYSVAFSPDGRTLASGSADNDAHLWNVETGALMSILTGHTDTVRAVAFSPDGRTLATGSTDTTVRLWDVETGNALVADSGAVNSVAFSPDGATLVTGSHDGTTQLWDVRGGKARDPVRDHEDAVAAVAFSPDGTTLVTGSSDTTAHLRDVRTGKTVVPLTDHEDWVVSVAFSPDGALLATGSRDATAQLWDAKTGETLNRSLEHVDTVGAVAFSPDGATLATGSHDNTARLWDVQTGAQIDTLGGHAGPVNSVAFSPDGATLATGSDDLTVWLWDVASGESRTTLPGHIGSVTSLAFSPDGHTLATSSADYTVRLWDVETGKALATLAQTAVPRSVAFSPDATTLAIGSDDGTVRLHDLDLHEDAEDAIETICRAVNRDLNREEEAAYLSRPVGPLCPAS